jgi:hypothetical protein
LLWNNFSTSDAGNKPLFAIDIPRIERVIIQFDVGLDLYGATFVLIAANTAMALY